MKKKTTKAKVTKHDEHSFEAHMDNIDHDLQQVANFYDKQVHNTIVFFGSAMIQPEEEAEAILNDAESRLAKTKRPTKQVWDAIESASTAVYMSHYYHAADELAYRFAKWSKKFKRPKNQYTLCSGGGPGIMEATNKGADRAGANSIGLRIIIPLEQKTNPYVSPELKFNFHYFFFRKFSFLQFARAIIVFPGGFGTLDEVFEILNLFRAKKILEPIPIVFFGSEFWKKVINFEPLVQMGMVSAENLASIHYSDDVEDAFEFVTKFLKSKKKAKSL